jgi:hypothetical protein
MENKMTHTSAQRRSLSKAILIIGLLFLNLGPARAAEKASGFDDALATIDATLEAQAGRVAVRTWTPTQKGSVRLVGSVQKLTENAEALIEVRVDGKSCWRRKLEVADTLCHGVDIAVLDVDVQSKVEICVLAKTMAVRVRTVFQIIPEPYLSRWRADAPTGYPTWSEEEKSLLRKKGQDVLQAIREASKEKRGKIVLPPGDYLFHARWSQASTLARLENLEIMAEGVTFWFEPPLIHGLLFEHCRNVSVRGLTIDFTIPCWFQARVIEVDRKAKTLRATFMKGYEPRTSNGTPENKGQRALMFYDATGRFINHQHAPGTWEASEDGTGVLCSKIERAGIPAALQSGDYVVGSLRTGAALRSSDCAGMRFEEVNIWSSPGMAVFEGEGEGGHVYHRVRATRRPFTNRLHAFGADIFHLAGTDRGPTLDRCELAYGADDNLNIHGSFGRVVQREGDRRYYLQGPYAVGDAIEFRNQKSLALLGCAKVTSVTNTPGGPSLEISDKYKAKGEALVELDKTLELPPLSLVVLDGKRSATGFVLRNCWLHDNFQRTLINGSPNGRIENNTLQNVGHGLVVQFETWGPWMEGPFARNLVVRNNRFIDSPPAGGVITVSMHPPGGGSNGRRFEAKPVTNMVIEGNTFGRTAATPLSIHNVDGLTIRNNVIDYPAGAPLPKGLHNTSKANWLYLQDCDAVSLLHNLTPER